MSFTFILLVIVVDPYQDFSDSSKICPIYWKLFIYEPRLARQMVINGLIK